MAKREIVTIHCDGPCGGANPIPVDYDATWILARSDRRYRYVDLCPSCSANGLEWLWSKGANRMADRPVTPEVRADRKAEHLRQVEETFPPQDGASVGLTVSPEGVQQVGPEIGQVREYTTEYTAEEVDAAELPQTMTRPVLNDPGADGPDSIPDDDVVVVPYIDVDDDDEPEPEPEPEDDGPIEEAEPRAAATNPVPAGTVWVNPAQTTWNGGYNTAPATSTVTYYTQTQNPPTDGGDSAQQ